MARSDGTSVQSEDSTMAQMVMKVFLYIAAWIDEHMDPNCVEDTTESEHGHPALHFKSTEVIEGCRFCFELEKEPVGNVVKAFKATWLPLLDAEIPELVQHFCNFMNDGEGAAALWSGNSKPIGIIVGGELYVLSVELPESTGLSICGPCQEQFH